jgi:2-oxo-3-hexenedioate decarboxylase
MIDDAARCRSDTDQIAIEILSALAEQRQIIPLTTRSGGLNLADAYRVTASVRKVREARGEHVVGRKIGFTNRTIWDEYDVHAPIWGYVYDRTLHRLQHLDGPFSLATLVEPRIEPEIVFGLGRPPDPGID